MGSRGVLCFAPGLGLNGALERQQPIHRVAINASAAITLYSNAVVESTSCSRSAMPAGFKRCVRGHSRRDCLTVGKDRIVATYVNLSMDVLCCRLSESESSGRQGFSTGLSASISVTELGSSVLSSSSFAVVIRP